MKLSGESIYIPNEVRIAIVRENHPNGGIVFIAKAIEDMGEFEDICPRPQPPWIKDIHGNKTYNHKDEAYLEKLKEWNHKQTQWLVMKSLEATPDLEWEKVNINDPSTYENLEQEFKDAGLNNIEIIRIFNGCLDANSLTNKHIKKAEEDFLASLVEAQQKSDTSPITEQVSTPSGDPVNASG